ncbi:MAG: AAA family ATPase [Methyloprofundus sp.]|nr:AAA family ATPase [Methyloprofundus sp.]
MNKHFIQQVRIKDFKCFTDFEAKGFARVNLIGGKNNVGKTAFMEACYVNVFAQNIKSFARVLFSIKFRRENLNLFIDGLEHDTQKFIEQSNHIFVQSNINTSFYRIEDKEGVKKYHFGLNREVIEINVNEFSFELSLTPSIQFIDNFGLANSDIIRNYSSIQKKDAEASLNRILNEFDASIEAFKVIDEKPQCKTNGQYLELTELGDGVRHLVSIVTSLYAAEDGYLFIDEMDNGIHYSMLDDLWKNILLLSEKLNVQVFATTHSKECIESFNRVQKALNDDKSIYFEMAKNIKTRQIFMRGLDADQLAYELTHQGKYRGE